MSQIPAEIPEKTSCKLHEMVILGGICSFRCLKEEGKLDTFI